jgi:hypothetical protein
VSRYYLTTAIDYVNSRPHLGTAYEKVTADVIARYKRLAGFDVHFPDGQRRALAERLQAGRRAGLHNNPVAYCDRMEEEFTSVWKALHCSYDDFIRTDAAAAQGRGAEDGAGVLRRRRHLRRRLRRLVLRLVRGVQAREGPRRRQVSAPPDADARSGSARRTTSSVCRSTAIGS